MESTVQPNCCRYDELINISNPKGEYTIGSEVERVEKSLAHAEVLLKKGEEASGHQEKAALFQASVVACYAAWEAFIEDQLLADLEGIVEQGAPEKLPKALKKEVTENKNFCPWDLAGDGWQEQAMRVGRRLLVGDEDGAFGLNTANPKNVIRISKTLIGQDRLAGVSWQKSTNKQVEQKIQELVELRGAIVHAQLSDRKLNAQQRNAWIQFTRKLCSKISDTKVDTQLSASVPGQVQHPRTKKTVKSTNHP